MRTARGKIGHASIQSSPFPPARRRLSTQDQERAKARVPIVPSAAHTGIMAIGSCPRATLGICGQHFISWMTGQHRHHPRIALYQLSPMRLRNRRTQSSAQSSIPRSPPRPPNVPDPPYANQPHRHQLSHRPQRVVACSPIIRLRGRIQQHHLDGSICQRTRLTP